LFKQMQQASAMPTLAWRIKRRRMPTAWHAASILVMNVAAHPAMSFLSDSTRAFGAGPMFRIRLVFGRPAGHRGITAQ
jgi:hypothetical protein